MATIKNRNSLKKALFLLPFIFFFSIVEVLGQERSFDNAYFGLDVFHGSVINHNKNISQLIHNHPQGFILSYNVRTFGNKRWQREYNYPDWGVTFLYEDFRYDPMGVNYSAGFHYNFYFFNRNLQLRLGQGLNYNTSPFDFDTNFKNLAFGSHITGFSQVAFQYTRPRLVGRWGLRAGIVLLHHSNGRVKAPNSGINVATANVGITYDINETPPEYVSRENDEKITEPIKFNFALRGGINESDFFKLGQHPFYIVSAYADKRLSFKNTIQFGTELIVSEFIRKEREYVSIAFPSRNVDPDVDHKRVGIFVGHEFNFNKLAVVTQLGYYVYWPSEYESIVYTRLGLRYFITDRYFVDATVRTHGANAEAIEWGIGIRI